MYQNTGIKTNNIKAGAFSNNIKGKKTTTKKNNNSL